MERQKKVLHPRNKNKRPQEELLWQFEPLEITNVTAEIEEKKSLVELEYSVKRTKRHKKTG